MHLAWSIFKYLLQAMYIYLHDNMVYNGNFFVIQQFYDHTLKTTYKKKIKDII